MKAVIYARYSSDRQTENSIEAQVRACTEYAYRNELEVAHIFKDEAISGKSTKNRAEYQRMMRQAENHKFDIILIHKYDRIARNLGDHINLYNKLADLDIKLIAVAQDFGEGKEAKMMKGMQWIMSEYYIDNLAEEVRKGHKEIALKGLHNGGYPPFGYDIKDQEYVINPIEANYVRRMFECAINKTGYTELLNEMDKAGIVGKRGMPLRRSSITEILHNEKYTGVYIYSPKEEKNRSNRRFKPNAIRIENAIPQIIDKDTWKEVQRIMDERKQVGKRSHRCSGIVYCECGAKMYLNRATRKGITYERFVCSEKCGAKTVKVEIIDKLTDLYINRLLCNENRKEIAKELDEYVRNENKMVREFEETRQEKIAEKQAELNNLMTNMAKADLPEIVIKQLGVQTESILKDIEKYKVMQPVRSVTPKLVNSWLDSVLKASSEELPKMLVEKIIVRKNEAEFISSLASLCDEYGCGGTQQYLHTNFPALFLAYILQL